MKGTYLFYILLYILYFLNDSPRNMRSRQVDVFTFLCAGSNNQRAADLIFHPSEAVLNNLKPILKLSP